MKNIHIIPTDKSSRLIHNDANQLCYQSNKSFKNDRKWMYRKKFNIYITSDEEIKKGDWYLDTTINVVFKNDNIFLNGVGYKKIILTTDQSLDGIQAIDDTFLEWFVKNPSCESVETYSLGVKNQLTGESGHYKYEIIIPKEYHEHGQEVGHSVQVVETLEEAAEIKFNVFQKENPIVPKNHIQPFKLGFINGAKWQQEKDKNKLTTEDINRHLVQALVEVAKQRMYDGVDLYSKIEHLIIMWSNDGTKTAGTLTKEIVELFKNI